MTSQKKRNRARKRVFAMIDEAWEVLAKGEEALAGKLAERAVTEGSVNPRVWVDYGRIQIALGRDRKGERALRHAIQMAPTYGEAFAALAVLYSGRGKMTSAVRFMTRAVELGREHADEWRTILERYREAAGDETDVEQESSEPVADDDEPEPPSELFAAVDAATIDGELIAKGIGRLGGVWTLDRCERLRAELARPERTGWEEVLGEGIGSGSWFDLSTPPPDDVAELRRALWGFLLGIAEHHARIVGREPGWPRTLRSFLASCAAAGQARCGLRLGRFPAGGGQTSWVTDRTELAFAFGAILCLGPGPVVVELVDLRPGRKRRARTVRLRPGDLAIHVRAERFVEIAGVYGLQAVAVGCAAQDEPVELLDVGLQDIG